MNEANRVLVVATWVLAFIIAEVIPFFSYRESVTCLVRSSH